MTNWWRHLKYGTASRRRRRCTSRFVSIANNRNQREIQLCTRQRRPINNDPRSELMRGYQVIRCKGSLVHEWISIIRGTHSRIRTSACLDYIKIQSIIRSTVGHGCGIASVIRFLYAVEKGPPGRIHATFIRCVVVLDCAVLVHIPFTFRNTMLTGESPCAISILLLIGISIRKISEGDDLSNLIQCVM